MYSRQRVDFNVAEFRRAIEFYGYLVTWEKSGICPCIPKNAEGQPDFNCVLCKGKGRYWYDPKTIRGIMTSFNESTRSQNPGAVESGTSYFTTMPDYKLGFWDRVTNFQSVIRFSEIIIKGNHGEKDSLRFKPTDILSVRTVDHAYVKNIDFMIDLEGSINWIPTGDEPERGLQYSVDYELHPRWIVIDLINILRDTTVKAKKGGLTFTPMPVRAQIRLEWFVS